MKLGSVRHPTIVFSDPVSGPARPTDPDAVLEWVERLATYCADQDGVPLIAGRLLGWLVICDRRPASTRSAAALTEACFDRPADGALT